ncbi:type IV pilus modification PilV family protein [Niallia sp. Krafla_26]|uniref:type IV pilus modification PilV family protein n=1 Tax=Niallia sp. Krafla_26 TaxID=3064703 RepID=UPI003D186701
MKNERGITLIELLVAVVISGIIIIPLLTILSGSYTRTIKQGEETQLMYFAQEVIEGIRSEGFVIGTTPTKYWCLNNSGCESSENSSIQYDAIVEVSSFPITFNVISNDVIEAYEVIVTAKSLSNNLSTELVTVVVNTNNE